MSAVPQYVLEPSADQQDMLRRELAVLVSRHNSRQTDQSLLLPEFDLASTNNLHEKFQEMEAQGYVIGDIVKHYPARKRWHTEWHVTVRRDQWEGTLAFLIPGDAC